MKMTDRTEMKAQLEEMLKELQERAGRIEARLNAPGNPDWEDHTTEHEDDEVLAGIGDLANDEIQQIKAALRRIESGIYGVCSSCNKPIPRARLSVLPYTSTCVSCGG